MNRHTLAELQELQALPLDLKVRLTQQRIREWINHYGENGVYVSFSGGKDSTVLLDIVRERYPDVKAMFVDIPTQYPELRDFVATYDNVDIVYPKISFVEVCEKYGFPLISKEVSECVEGARKYLTSILNEQNDLTDRQTDRQTVPYRYFFDKVTGTGKYKKKANTPDVDKQSLKNLTGGGTTGSTAELEELASLLEERRRLRKGGQNQRLAIMLGMLTNEQTIKANIPEKDKSQFSLERYKFFLDAPFEISNKCCSVMKKNPAHKYHKDTGRVPITAQMASESRLRTQKWLQNSCNGFNLKIPTSNPMSFWTEQDVLLYIRTHNLPICSVYGDIVTDDEEAGQIDLSEWTGMGIFDQTKSLHCTGCKRTGCVCCGFGAHMSGDTRFIDLHETHKQMYRLLDIAKNNGYTMREAIDWINEHGNLNIKY